MKEHSGAIVDGVQVSSFLQCPHCGAHFESRPGSGKRRTWCTHCMAVTCGELPCDVCIPVEARLEHSEGTKTLYDEKIRELVASGAVLL